MKQNRRMRRIRAASEPTTDMRVWTCLCTPGKARKNLTTRSKRNVRKTERPPSLEQSPSPLTQSRRSLHDVALVKPVYVHKLPLISASDTHTIVRSKMFAGCRKYARRPSPSTLMVISAAKILAKTTLQTSRTAFNHMHES